MMRAADKIIKPVDANPVSENGVAAVFPPVPDENAFGIKEEFILSEKDALWGREKIMEKMEY